jgi:hypothetical protein
MSLLFVDGFDHYATADIDKKYNSFERGTGAVLQINTGEGRRSTRTLVARAGSAAAGHARVYKNIDNSETVVIGFAFSVNAAPTANSTIVGFLDGGTVQAGISLRTNLELALFGNGVVLPGTFSQPIPLNTFVYVEAKIKITDAVVVGDCILRINGVEVGNATSGSTKSTANSYVNVVRVGVAGGVFSHTCRYDDLYICNATGSINNNFLGDCRVDAIRPTADGFYADSTPSSGSDRFAMVNDTTPNTTDYVITDALGEKDSYEFQNLTPISSRVVYGAQVLAAVAKGDSGTRQMAVLARSGSTDVLGPNFAPSVANDYVYARHVVEQDPNTSGLWTQTSINNAEFGFEVTE